MRANASTAVMLCETDRIFGLTLPKQIADPHLPCRSILCQTRISELFDFREGFLNRFGPLPPESINLCNKDFVSHPLAHGSPALLTSRGEPAISRLSAGA
jgi:hypothetical protein